MGHVVENCPYRRIDSYKQNNVKSYSSSRSRTPTLVGCQHTDRLRDISQRKYKEQTGTKWLQGIPETEGCKASIATAYEWNQLQLGKENTHQFNLYEDARVLEENKPSKLQDHNVTDVSAGSNTSEIFRAMEKISETNQLLSQLQMVQQRVLQALLHHQEQSSEVQETSQRIQSQALVALTEVAQQRGFDPLFNKIAKYNGCQHTDRLRDISQRKYKEQTGTKWLQGIPETEGCKASIATAYEWNQLQLGKENTHQFNLYEDARVLEENKPSKLQDHNVTDVSAGSNTSEIFRAMEKISETNQLLSQLQMVQQRVLQALLHHQEQSSEVQETSQRIQSQALVALTEVAQQRGFDPLFNKIAKYNGKDPEKCHY